MTVLFTISAFLICLFSCNVVRYWCAFGLTAALVIIQLWRESLVLFPRITVQGVDGEVCPAFGYAFSLSRTRGIPEQTATVISATSPPSSVPSIIFPQENEDQTTMVRRDIWRSDFMETYRHMREHGNSAFMFLAELELAALVYCVITMPSQTPVQQLGNVGTLLALWTIPAMFVHLLGQHLERRFSRFDRRLEETGIGE